MTPRQQQIYNTVQRLGSKSAAARELGLDSKTIRYAYAMAEAWLLGTDEGIKAALESTGLSTETGKHGWRRVQNKETGSWDSVFWKTDTTQEDITSWADLFREALGAVPDPLPAPMPDDVSHDLLPRYIIADVHFGMRAWADETGAEYSIAIAAQRLAEASATLIGAAPYTDRAIILNVGDTLHQNDSKNMTPTSSHILDVDGRFAQAAMAAVRAHVNMIEAAKAKHRQIDVVILAGNHDPDFSPMLWISLFFKYEADERVTVHLNPSKMWVMEFGRNMLAAHHGDKTKPERLVQQAADVHAPIWGRTYWRYLDTGHIHQDSGRDIGGMSWESHRAITTRDAAAAAFGYTGRSTMKCIIVHRERGEVMRHTAAIG